MRMSFWLRRMLAKSDKKNAAADADGVREDGRREIRRR